MSKLPLKDILAAVDMGAKENWDQLSDDEKKQESNNLMNRYDSSVKGSRDKQELAVFKTNEYYNKQFSFCRNTKSYFGNYYVWLETQRIFSIMNG